MGDFNPQEITCKNCIYSVREDLRPEMLGMERGYICKRLPPSPVLIGVTPDGQANIAPLWPVVNGDGWCWALLPRGDVGADIGR